jgi:hypothetical protein
MDTQSLPRYFGLPDSPRGWGEQDGHGKRPSVFLRDWVVLSLLVGVCFPILLSLAAHLWACHQDAERMNSAREKEMEQEVR